MNASIVGNGSVGHICDEDVHVKNYHKATRGAGVLLGTILTASSAFGTSSKVNGGKSIICKFDSL